MMISPRPSSDSVSRTDTHGSRDLKQAPVTTSLSWKGMIAGAVLLWPNAYWLVQMEIIRGSAHPTTVSLFFNCIFLLLVITVANHCLAAVRPRWALTRADLLLVYSMLAIGSCVAGHDSLE